MLISYLRFIVGRFQLFGGMGMPSKYKQAPHSKKKDLSRYHRIHEIGMFTYMNGSNFVGKYTSPMEHMG